MQLYQIFKIGFYVCLGLAVLFLVLGIVLFFLFDIRSIHKVRAGREKAKAIREMEQNAASTGRMVGKKNTQRKSGQLKDQRLVITKGTVLSPEEADGSAVTAEMGAKGTAAQGADDSRTDVLGAVEAETAVLGAEKAETAVLDAPTQRFGEAETSVLVQAANIRMAGDVHFEVVKKVICCESDKTA